MAPSGEGGPQGRMRGNRAERDGSADSAHFRALCRRAAEANGMRYVSHDRSHLAPPYSRETSRENGAALNPPLPSATCASPAPRPLRASAPRRPGTPRCPRLARRRQSAWTAMPLSATTTRSAGISGVSRSQTSSEVSKVRRSRLLTPISRPSSASARSSSVFVVDLDQHVEAEVVRGLVERARAVVVDRGHDDEDAIGAPGARLQHLIGIERKSLRRIGRWVAARAFFR